MIDRWTDPKTARDELMRESGGLALVDKPYGATSFSIVNRIRGELSHATGIRRLKCGHGGTLDPLASGLMIVATRRQTRRLSDFLGLDKVYFLRVRFGVTSASFDLERPIEITDVSESLTERRVMETVLALEGEHQQVPPAHSAIKQQGKPVYQKARRGEEVTLAPRRIIVHGIQDVSVNFPYVAFRAHVSKGTYIRALARDLGASLGTGALVTELRREAIGPYKLADALSRDDVINIIRNG